MYKRIAASAFISCLSGMFAVIAARLLLPQEHYSFEFMAIVSLLALGISSIVFCVLIQRALRQEISQVDQQLERILNMQGGADSAQQHSLFDPVYHRANSFVSNFKGAATEVGETSDRVAIGSAEISWFLDTLGNTIVKNVNHANQISVATEEILQSTSSITETANNVSRVVGEARTHSDDGIEAIESITQQIHEFMRSVKTTANDARSMCELSGKIQSITQVINGVAEQTNLLALNAAIEAARAGEHGRGFAVVADEVRTLANQTTKATQEIGDMLKEVQQQTESSVKTMTELEKGVTNVVSISENARETFSNIHHSTIESEAQINEINSILQEHLTATSDISTAVVGISQQMEKTGKQVHEVSIEASTLSETGEKLGVLLSHYELGTRHETYRKLAMTCASDVAAIFEAAISRGDITEQQLFDRDYKPISNTNPVKFTTQFDSFTDKVLPPVQEPVLQRYPDILFAGAVDNNGYFPTHNKRYSKTLSGNYEQDLANNRTKRLFNDRTGSRCGNNKEPFLLQTYKRDTGEIMHDISAPVFVLGKHWGGFRIGYRSE